INIFNDNDTQILYNPIHSNSGASFSNHIKGSDIDYAGYLEKYSKSIFEHVNNTEPPLVHAIFCNDDAVDNYDIEYIAKFIKENKINIGRKIPKLIKRLYKYSDQLVSKKDFRAVLSEEEIPEYIDDIEIVNAALSNIKNENISLL